MLNADEKPIDVSPSTLPDQAFALMRQLVLIFGGAATLMTLFGQRDVEGILEFLQSSDFLQAVVAALTLAALIYGNLKSRWRKQQLITAADAAPDRVARVVKR